MQRRSFLSMILAGSTFALSPRLLASEADFKRFHDFEVGDQALARLDRSPEYWRQYLDEPTWQVLFEEATERAFSSPLDKHYEDGSYVCAACHLPLFSSTTKYDSGTGWPSFWQAYARHMGTKQDYKLLWPRTEYHCIRCGGHQGHIFDDGPDPTGKRWCNNGLALRFVPADNPLPALRG